ncbi:hypothetical protein WR25_11386 [Diploscapter pachys]|uniref:Tubulin-specific chaperone E n=1 Tax=Diploscapter pachys TaxID=2018661 RepID=A0A2A2J7N2_9BILA|nr:hypothetical protein WR25_11386 [Diploscapter pachys]
MPSVGDRIDVEGDRGTLRYVGEVEGHSGMWYGIEWDNETRGKHDGQINARRYFHTRRPKNGSFIRPPAANFGVDFLTELKHRYEGHEMEEIDVSWNSKRVETVGMEKIFKKQSNIHNLVHIVLDNRLVSSAPPTETAPFPRCLELNLHGNLLHKWDDVRKILLLFPKLEELVLRKNQMDPFEDEGSTSSVFSISIRRLVISDCNLSAKSISNLLLVFPSVSELISLGNGLSSFSAAEASARLTILDLENNSIRSFETIQGKFDKLTKLSLANCGISKIEIGSEGSRFSQLNVLNLKSNSISDWNSINELRNLRALQTLYIDCNQLQCEAGIHIHEVIIAKIPTLIDLNRFEVSAVERRSAEVRFINKYAGIAEEKRQPHKEDLERLVKLHGPPSVDTAKQGLSVIKLPIQFGDRVLQRTLPLSMTVEKITELLCRLFCVQHSNKIRLELERSDDGQIVAMDNGLRELEHYSPEQGDTLRLVIS